MAEGAEIASGRLRPQDYEIDNGKPLLTWDRHPNNPMRQDAPE
jgi:hypothetical protein